MGRNPSRPVALLSRQRALAIARNIRAGRLSVQQAADAMIAWAEAGPASAERTRAEIVYHLVSGRCPTVAAIARACGLGYQATYRRLQALEAQGVVRVSGSESLHDAIAKINYPT